METLYWLAQGGICSLAGLLIGCTPENSRVGVADLYGN